MGKKEKLLHKAKNSPSNFKFTELCLLAEKFGFKFRNQSGSHKIYKHEEYGKMMNFQPNKKDKSKAKQYQIEELIAFIEDNDLNS